MEWNELLIRYGELSLKGRNRNVFVRKLKNNIKDALSDLKTVVIKPERDRMFLFADDQAGYERSDCTIAIYFRHPIVQSSCKM